MPFEKDQIITYLEMSLEENTQLQRGMNFRLKGTRSIFLMSTRNGSPYEDEIIEDGQVLIYEGHDVPKNSDNSIPKIVDQVDRSPQGTLTQNGKFFEAAMAAKNDGAPPERIRVYEKLFKGTWVYNGIFELTDAWKQPDGMRSVFKFRLELSDNQDQVGLDEIIKTKVDLPVSRLIPSEVKHQVFVRDEGSCNQCGSKENLHYDHIFPYSKGGTSFTSDNIQLLCAKHNLEKSDRVE